MKRFIPMLLALCMLFGIIPVNAIAAATISGSESTAEPGDIVTATLNIEDNPGIASWTVVLTWDAESLFLNEQNITLGESFSGGLFAARSTTDGQLRMAWAGMMNAEADGTLVTLSFTISDDAAPGIYPIEITATSANDQDGETVPVITSAAEIVLPKAEPIIRPVAPIRPEKPEEDPEEPEKPEEEPPMTIPFTDVAETAYYYQPVLWAAENGIATGTTSTTFSPEQPCTRAQAVTFLWRAAGSPEPQSVEHPFTDISADAYYYKAVLWAVERGITNGTSVTTFSPNDTVTRAQIAAFLYRNEQADGGGFQGVWMFRIPFTDLPDWAFESIAWCYMKSITTGTSETTFSPDDPCTRGQIVTFLYRTFAEQEN